MAASAFPAASRPPPLPLFIAAAALFHLAVLSWLPPMRAAPPALPRPLEVHLSAPEPQAWLPPRPTSARTETVLTAPAARHRPAITTTSPAPAPPVPLRAATDWRETSHAAVLEAAREAEHTQQAQEHTPLAELMRALQQPHSESRLANGLLKITTESGRSLCYQPPPAFARDLSGLYGIPTTCP
ncbi:hypothetical protein [Ferriphaselus sp. R-1]|uniref:hypothetical protein n=1 Tax=Ferriphaselus sp. R-1 TaxID=1485544 RepID=UPI00054D86A9|nr:hypothetical protein [Ferriphaselus sp. R-1]